MPRNSREPRSTIAADGTLRIELERVSVAEPGKGELLVRVEAAPITSPGPRASVRSRRHAYAADR